MEDPKLKNVKIEDFLLIIFIILFFLKLHSNKVEKDYRINHNLQNRKKYHDINVFTFIVALIISIYYIYCNCKEEKMNYLLLIANILTLITVIIFIYLEITDDD